MAADVALNGRLAEDEIRNSTLAGHHPAAPLDR